MRNISRTRYNLSPPARGLQHRKIKPVLQSWWNYRIETDFVVTHRRWGQEHMLLDCLGNHLPYDSRGSLCRIQVLQDRRWLPLHLLNRSRSVQRIMFDDNGRGYGVDLLGILGSPKSRLGKNIGQFGEGIKLACCAALRLGILLTLYSKNWSATPVINTIIIDGRPVNLLAFQVRKHFWPIRGSRTLIDLPSPELVEGLLRIPEKVLYFRGSFRTLFSLQGLPNEESEPGRESGLDSRILDLGQVGKEIFVKGMQKDISTGLLFDYDLVTSAVSPDRDIVDENVATEIISRMLRSCDEPQVIDRLLKAAAEFTEEPFLEFQVLSDQEDTKVMSEIFPHASLWVERFFEQFGKTALLASADENLNVQARDRNYRPIAVNPMVKSFFKKLGMPSVAQVMKEESTKVKVPPSQYSGVIRVLLGFIPSIHAHLEIPNIPRITVFSGTKRQGLYGVGKDHAQMIFLHVDAFTDLRTFLHTYLMALGELTTRKFGVEREYVEFFVRSWARIIQKTS